MFCQYEVYSGELRMGIDDERYILLESKFIPGRCTIPLGCLTLAYIL
jgi:hypothetical protein